MCPAECTCSEKWASEEKEGLLLPVAVVKSRVLPPPRWLQAPRLPRGGDTGLRATVADAQLQGQAGWAQRPCRSAHSPPWLVTPWRRHPRGAPSTALQRQAPAVIPAPIGHVPGTAKLSDLSAHARGHRPRRAGCPGPPGCPEVAHVGRVCRGTGASARLRVTTQAGRVQNGHVSARVSSLQPQTVYFLATPTGSRNPRLGIEPAQ